MLNLKNLYKSQSNYFGKIFKAFNLTEKVLFTVLILALIISGLGLLNKLNSVFLTKQPTSGGSISEGIIGSPRFINPLLELSDADRDLTYLIYSGLMRAAPQGNLIPDLAESYLISDDGLTYTFKIKNDAVFHDGKKVTADDIAFTVEMAQNTSLRSSKKNNWTGVTAIKINDEEIAFELKQPYSPFLENTTLGILPKHIWSSATADEFPFSPYNTEPVGSGPFQIEKISRNSSGIPNYYELKSFNNYVLGTPYIDIIKFNFYPNEKELIAAYLSNEIESTSALPPQTLSDLKKDNRSNEQQISLPRIFGVFFNQNQAPVFLNKEVRTALNMTVDKQRIVSEVLNNYGETIDSPVPNGVLTTKEEEEIIYNREEEIQKAKELLIKNGWVMNEETNILEKIVNKKVTDQLTFSISTSNTTDLKKTAEILKEDWELLGAKVDIQTFAPSDLNQSVISQRKYDALLFGEIVGRSLDLFAFWHSSQRNSGYNVAMYTNSKADKLLEEARQIADRETRLQKYSQFITEIQNDVPAIFIYSPQFIYLLPKKIQGFDSGLINNQSERFEGVYQWYIETDKVWKFLAKD